MPEENARAASPQPHRCAECVDLRRQLEDLRRENELLQVELEVARMSKDDSKVGEFIAAIKNKKTSEYANENSSKQPHAASPRSASTAGVVDLSQISFQEISELRHLRRAPAPVVKTLEALATALSYTSSEELLADASLVSKLKTFAETDEKTKKLAMKKIARVVADLTPERVMQCNRPAGLLFAWLLQTVRSN
jgi:hypothetical protein